jgi:hypothetical protein
METTSSPIRRLVINDIGAHLPWAGLARLGSYVSAMPSEARGGDKKMSRPGSASVLSDAGAKTQP